MLETVNIHETDGGSVTVGLPSFEMEDIRRKLIALRVQYGANTPVGHRCSNLIEQIQAFDKAGDERLALAKSIDRTMRELAALIRNPQ